MTTTALVLTDIEARVDARVPGWESLLRLRDHVKSNPDLQLNRPQLVDMGFDHALLVLDRPIPRRAESGRASWLLLVGVLALLGAGLGAASGWVPAQLDGRWLAVVLLVAGGYWLAHHLDSPTWAEVGDDR